MSSNRTATTTQLKLTFHFFSNFVTIFRRTKRTAMIASGLGRAISFALVFLLVGIKSVNCKKIGKCNFVLISDSGMLTSPNHPNSYPPDSKCSWLIVAEQPISFSFTHFNLLENKTWLTIYDGPRESSPILLNETSNSIRASIVSTSSIVLVTLKSTARSEEISNKNSLGFYATYEPFRCQYELSSDWGQFTSINHPGNYLKNTDCRWLIQAQHPIVLLFLNSSLEKCHDWLTIYDGPTESSAVLLNSTTLSSIKSTSNQILVTFKSGGTGSCSGFNAIYSAYENQNLLSSESGWFTSPNHLSNYPDNSDYRWFIDTKEPVNISLSLSKLQRYSDWLTIYDGPTVFSPVLLKTSSGGSISSFFVSTAHKVLVTFVSDEYRSYSGFNITYSPYRCNHVLSSESGWFTTLNYPRRSPRHSKCSWLINANDRIVISFFRIDFYDRGDQHFLMIYDGPTESSPILKPSGFTKELSFVSTSHQMLVTFDPGSLTTVGFNATYSTCRVVSSQSGKLVSPTYQTVQRGIIPYSSSHCWLINASVPLQFKFDRLESPSRRDGLGIYNGPTQSSEFVFGQKYYEIRNNLNNLIDLVSPEWPINSTASQILITLASGMGDSAPSEFNLSFSPRCEFINASESGWITSPNYPLDYPSNSDYCWVINSTHPIMITFPEFNLEVNHDWLRIYDGPTSSSAVLLEASSNYTVPSSIVSTAHQVLVHFKSDSQYSYSGFRVGYSNYIPGITEKPIECLETIHVNSSGFILTSVNYPLSYPKNTRCNWRFISEPDNLIQISFTDFSTHPEDYVSAFDRENDNREGSGFDNIILLASGVNASLPLSCNYVSTSNWMHVSFNPSSDPSKNQLVQSNTGFRAIVKAINNRGCGENHINKDSSGVLFGFHNNPQHLGTSGCVWRIQVRSADQVNLTLNTLLGSASSYDLYSLVVFEGFGSKADDTLLVNMTGFSSHFQPFFVISNSNKITVLLNDATKYNKDKCRPREPLKLKLAYKKTNSWNYGCYGRMNPIGVELLPSPIHPNLFAPKTLLWCEWKVGKRSVTSLGDVTILDEESSPGGNDD